jgi:Tropinone reductase 1
LVAAGILPGLTGKRALVTGGTRGIGRAVVELLARSGAEVFVVARDGARLDERLEGWRSEGDFAVDGLAMDVTDAEARAQLCQRLEAKGPTLDIAVLNVGTNIRKAAVDYTAAEVETVFDTNQRAAFAMATALYPLLAHSEAAALVYVLSVAAHTHLPTGAPYGMTKAALVQLVRNLAVEWAPKIRVNAVSPWYTRTPLVEGVLADPTYLERVLEATPLARIAEPAEVAAPIAFLASPAASYITGQTLPVDGGFLARGF